jgi:dTDP-4-dehydrorhamnose 3,5-epimerase
MEKTELGLAGLLVLEPEVHRDERGFFVELFNLRRFEELTGLDVTFVQDNLSQSSQHVLRGLHYQLPPRAQGKLVSVVRGEVFDVAVDVRHSSPSFGQWVGITLSERNRRQFWIPSGFAHGFIALTEHADVFYKVTDYFSSEHDRSLRWDDPEIGIEWPLDDEPILSVKDASAPFLRSADLFG